MAEKPRRVRGRSDQPFPVCHADGKVAWLDDGGERELMFMAFGFGANDGTGGMSNNSSVAGEKPSRL